MNTDALVASSLWWQERQAKGAHDYIKRTMPFLFDVIDSLYLETRKLPLHSLGSVPAGNRQVSTSYTLTFGIFLTPAEYSTLRAILSLTGDIYNLVTPLTKLKSNELLELDQDIRQLFKD